MDELPQPVMKASRNKHWSEKTPEEKIEFLARELTRTQEMVARQGRALTKLYAHDHLDGRLVERIQSMDEESYGGFWFRVEEFNK